MIRSPPFLHRVPWGRFPDLIGRIGDSDFLIPLPSALVVLALRYRPHSLFAPRGGKCSLPRGLGLSSGSPARFLLQGRRYQDLPGSLEARWIRAPLFDPGGGTRARPVFGPLPFAFRFYDSVGLHEQSISGLNHAARILAVYASHRRLPDAAQHSLPGGETSPSRAGLSPAGLLCRVSRRGPTSSTSPQPELPWRTIDNFSPWRGCRWPAAR